MFNLMPGMPNAGALGGALGLPEQWLMHEGSGDTFADATANDNTITATDITWGTGTGVTSPTFNGSTSTAVAAQAAITNFDGTAPFSVSIWLSISIGGRDIQVPLGTSNGSANGQGWEIYTSGGLPSFVLNDASGNQVNVQSNFSIGVTPANFIATYGGCGTASCVSLYLNGALTATSTLTNNLSGSTASGLPLFLGATSMGTYPFYGSMSNLQIFSGVLTSGQIAAIQTAGP